MKRIDFLPQHYQERSAQRADRLWLRGVVLLFGAVISAAALGQYSLYRSVKLQRDALAEPEAAVSSLKAQTDQLTRELAHWRQQADLAAYLKHPWPRTRILREIVESLPEELALVELRLSRRGPAAATWKPTEQQEDSAPGPRRDLENLRHQCDSQQILCEITGSTTEPARIHGYVDALSVCPLFSSATLRSLETVRRPDGTAQSRFVIETVLIPGYGQTGGPREPLRLVAQFSPEMAAP